MSNVITVVKSADIETSGGQTEGMLRQNAIVDVCDKMCSLIMKADAKTSSAIHHHGEQNTIIYAVKGHGSVITNGGKTRQDLAPGDFAFIPAFLAHQEVNESDEEVVFAIVRSGRLPFTENLSGWEQASTKQD